MSLIVSLTNNDTLFSVVVVGPLKSCLTIEKLLFSISIRNMKNVTDIILLNGIMNDH